MQLNTFGSFFQSMSHSQKVARIAPAKDSEKSTLLSAEEKGQNHMSAAAITARIAVACYNLQEIVMDISRLRWREKKGS